MYKGLCVMLALFYAEKQYNKDILLVFNLDLFHEFDVVLKVFLYILL